MSQLPARFGIDGGGAVVPLLDPTEVVTDVCAEELAEIGPTVLPLVVADVPLPAPLVASVAEVDDPPFD